MRLDVMQAPITAQRLGLDPAFLLKALTQADRE